MIWETIRQAWDSVAQFAGDHDKSIVAIGTLFLAAFTVVLAITTVFLWKATRDLVHDAQDKGERQLRAYVSLVGRAMAHATVDNNQPGYLVQIELKNSGVTPGYDFTTWIMPPEIRIDDSPFGPPRPESERTGKSVIAPNTSAWINSYYLWKPGELDAVRKREKGVFIWGGANYKDAFGEPRKFVFRIMISGAENAGNGTAWALAPHRLGYEAD